MQQNEKIFSIKLLMEGILILVCFFAMFPIHKDLFTVPFYTDDNAIRYATGHLFQYGSFDLRLFEGYPTYLIPPFFSANLWIFLFSSFDFLPAPFIYNVTHILWLLLTPIWSRVISFSITQDADIRQIMNIFLTPFLLLTSIVLIWSGSLHWGIIILFSFLLFYASKKLVLEKKNRFIYSPIIFCLTAIMMYINRVALIYLVLLVAAFIFLKKRNAILLSFFILLGLLADSSFLWHEFYYSFTQGSSAMQEHTFMPYSPLLVFFRVLKIQFFKQGNYIFLILYPMSIFLLAGLFATVKKKLSDEEKLLGLLCLLVGTYIVFSYTLGGRLFFNTNPQRFLFFVYPAVTYFACRPIAQVVTKKTADSLHIVMALLLICLFSLRLFQYGPIMPKALPQPFTDLAQWLNKNTNTNARILVEGARHQFSEKGQLVHPLYDSHLYLLLGLKVKREFAGGLVPWLEGSKTTGWPNPMFINGEIFYQHIKPVSTDNMMKQLKLYNIGWIVCWTKTSEQYFHQHKNHFTHEATIGKYIVFSVNKKFSFIDGGQGWAKVDYKNGYIDVNLKNRPQQIVLKYHWWKNIATEPAVNIKQVFLGQDPIGFIQIENPPQHFKIIYE